MPACRCSFDFKSYAETKSINYTYITYYTNEIKVQNKSRKFVLKKKLDGGCNSFTILESRHLS